MSWLRALLWVVFVGLAVAAAVVWWVLESSGVGVIETQRPDGKPRHTHVWFVDLDGLTWLEAANSNQEWYQDVRQNSHVVLRSDGREASFVAIPYPSNQAHDYVRKLLREKYGLRDRVLGWAVDTSKSVAVELSPTQ